MDILPGRKNIMRKLLRSTYRFWSGGLSEWTSIVLVFLTMAIALFSIEQANWITPQPSLMLTLALAVLASVLLIKSRVRDATAHLVIVILGFIVTVWQSSLLIVLPETASWLSGTRLALYYWWQAVSTVKPSEGIMHFALFLVFLTWILGYVSTWFALRKQNVWITVLLGTIAIMVNISNLPKEYHYLLPVYLMAAMLLVGQATLAKEHNRLKEYDIKPARRSMLQHMTVVFSLGALTVTGAWFVPDMPLEQPGFITNINAALTRNLEKHWLNFFASVPGKWSIIRSSEQETLLFEDPVPGDSRIQFVITSDQSFYWRARMYDLYNTWGWSSTNITEHKLEPGMPAGEGETVAARQIITYTVENKLKTDVLLTAGEFVSSDIPVLLKTLSANVSGTTVMASHVDIISSADEASVAPPLRIAKTSDPESGSSTEADSGRRSPPSQATAADSALPKDGTGEIVAVIAPQLLKPNQRYTVTASLTVVTPDELSEAGDDYAQWVTDYYLQLPDDLSEGVRQLSQDLTEEAETPYEKVTTLQKFLIEFKYNKVVEPPPEGVGGVSYFLFVQQEGNCTYFSSAMVVMLRSVGVPARLSLGYLPGKYDDDSGKFLVRARDYHAWPEVYFPGYGWVGFEVTPRFQNLKELISEGSASINTDEWLDEELYDLEDEGVLLDITPYKRYRRNTVLPIVGPVIGILFLLTLVAGLVLRHWLEQFRGVYNPVQAYAKMSVLASLGRVGPRPPETPLEYCSRLALAFPAQSEDIDYIAKAYTETQFSPRKELDSYQIVSLQKCWRRISRNLIKHIFRWKRWSIRDSFTVW